MTMPPILSTQIFPVPIVVGQNLSRLAALSQCGARVVLTPDTELGVNLRHRGAFLGLKILGLLDGDLAKTGTEIEGWTVYGYDNLPHLQLDAVLVTSLRYHEAIVSKLIPCATQLGFEIIDLCEGYDARTFRSEVANAFSRQLWPYGAEALSRFREVEIRIPEIWGFGDKLCALSAARMFARQHPELKVSFPLIPKVLEAFGDDLVSPGVNAPVLQEFSTCFHRERHSSIAMNYLGCYVLGLGLDFESRPALELPNLPPLPNLEPGSYCVMQPHAGWARPNLRRRQLDRLAAACPLPVFLAGKPDTGEGIPHASEAWLGDELTMLRLIRHAGLVMAPRSATAHVAAGYRVPSIIWVPDDGENWHLDYPDWEHRTVFVQEKGVLQTILDHAQSLLDMSRVTT